MFTVASLINSKLIKWALYTHIILYVIFKPHSHFFLFYHKKNTYYPIQYMFTIFFSDPDNSCTSGCEMVN